MNRFEETLLAHDLTLTRSALQTLQISVGRKCNQARTASIAWPAPPAVAAVAQAW